MVIQVDADSGCFQQSGRRGASADQMWDDSIEKARRHDLLTPSERERASEAIAYLRSLFAVRDPFSTDGFHPIVEHIFNNAPWTRRWLAGLVDCLERTRAAGNSAQLRRMFLNPAEYREALSLLELTDLFLGSGWDVQLDPQVPSGRADLEVRRGSAGMYVEHTTKGESAVEAAAWAHSRAAWARVHSTADVSVAYTGRFGRPLQAAELDELESRIAACVAAARSAPGVHGFELAAGVMFAAAASADDPALLAWARSRGFTVNIIDGVSYQVEELDRIRSAISKKARRGQLPRTSDGLLVIEGHRLHGLIETGAEGLLRTIQDHLAQFDWILGAVLSVPGHPWSNKLAATVQGRLGGRVYCWADGGGRVYTLIRNVASNTQRQQQLQRELEAVFGGAARLLSSG